MKTLADMLENQDIIDENIRDKIYDFLGNLEPSMYMKYRGRIIFRLVNDIDRNDDVSPVTSFNCKKCEYSINFVHEISIGDSAFTHAHNMTPKEVICPKCKTEHIICYIQDNTVRKDRYKFNLRDPN